MSTNNLRLRGRVVYFAQREDGAIKIGTTSDLDARLVRLNSEHGPVQLLGTVQGSHWLERQVHRQFASARIEGEWFKATDQLLAAADGVGIPVEADDPFHHADPVPNARVDFQRLYGRGEPDETRLQIQQCWKEGLTGKQTAHILALSPAKVLGHVKVMAQLGYFNARR